MKGRRRLARFGLPALPARPLQVEDAVGVELAAAAAAEQAASRSRAGFDLCFFCSRVEYDVMKIA